MNYNNTEQTDDLIGGLTGKFGDGSGVKSQTKTEKTEILNFKNGDTVFRVLPPMFSCVNRNIWAIFYARHWIMCSNGSKYPLLCTKIYDNKTQQYLDTCKFCKLEEPKRKLYNQTQQNYQDKRAELEATKDTLVAEDVIALQDEVEGAKEAYQIAKTEYSPLERKFWVNVMMQDGTVKLAGLPKTVYEGLAGKKEKDQKERVGGLFRKLRNTQDLDGIAVDGGVWVVVSRTGSDQYTTEYQVSTQNEIEEIMVNGKKKKTEYVKECPLSDSQQHEALKKGKDLNSVFDYSRLTSEEQERFINTGFDNEVLLEIFRSKRPLTTSDVSQ